MPTQEIDLGNVQGPKGDTGPQGPQGAQGPEGPQGPPGEVDADTAIAFAQASTRTNIISGESIKTVFGKAAKWFADLKTGAFATVVNNLTTTTANTVLDGRQGKALDVKITELKEALKNVLNLNSKQLTNSSYYPTSYMYRSGQNIYLRCSGVTTKEVPQGTELVVATEGTVPESFRPDIDLIFYAVVSAGGAIVRVSVSASGKVTFTAQEKLVEGFGVNLHVNYITGKNPL